MIAIKLCWNGDKVVTLPFCIWRELEHRGVSLPEDAYGQHPGRDVVNVCRKIFHNPRGLKALGITDEMWQETSDPEFMEWIKASGIIPEYNRKDAVTVLELPLVEAVMGSVMGKNGPVTDVKYMVMEYRRPVMLLPYSKKTTSKERKQKAVRGPKLF